MTFAMFIAFSFLTCIVLGLARTAGRADDHAERVGYVDWQEYKTQAVIREVRRQQHKALSRNRHLIVSQSVRPWRRTIDEFDELYTEKGGG